MSLHAWTRKHYLYGMGRGAMLRKYLRIKPVWTLKNLALALSKPVAGILIEGREIARTTGSALYRIDYRQASRFCIL